MLMHLGLSVVCGAKFCWVYAQIGVRLRLHAVQVDQHDISRRDASYVGKLRSNFLGTEFALYDGGSKSTTGSPFVTACRCSKYSSGCSTS